MVYGLHGPILQFFTHAHSSLDHAVLSEKTQKLQRKAPTVRRLEKPSVIVRSLRFQRRLNHHDNTSQEHQQEPSTGNSRVTRSGTHAAAQ